MYASSNRADVQNAKAKLSDSYTKLLREITSSSGTFSIGNYSIIRLIGTGSFGKVYLAVHKFTKTKVVLKSSPKDQPNLVREIHHHRQFKHPHIARLYEIIVTETLVWMVLEYCPGDELYTYLINNNGQLKDDEIRKVFSELCGAVAYTHSRNCAHRDIKLENTLLDKRHNVKLCDFGFTREYESNRSLLETVCGTSCYMAPEMLMGKKYSGEAVDVWSLGVILYTLLYGEMPFEEENELDTKFKIINEEPSYNEKHNRLISHDAKDLTMLLLSKDPKLRPSLDVILNHSYLDDFGIVQRAILSTKEPKLFSTKSEKKVLRSLKSANIDLNSLIDSVLSQNCDSLAGFWALAVEKQVKLDSKKHRRSSLGIKLSKRDDREDTTTTTTGNKNMSISTNIIKSTSNRFKSSSIPSSPLSPLGKFTSSVRSSSEPERDKLNYSDDNTSHPPPPPPPPLQMKSSTSNSMLNQTLTVPNTANTINTPPSTPSKQTPPAATSTPILTGLSGLTLSNSTIDKSYQPSISSHSSILERARRTTSKDIKASIKSTMMKLIFVGNLKRRQSIHPEGITSTAGTTSTTLASNKITMSQPNLRGLEIHTDSILINNHNHNHNHDTNNSTNTTNNTTTSQSNPDIAEADSAQNANLSFGSDYYNDTLSTTHTANSITNINPNRKLSKKVRPISQISQISAYSQLSQYSMNSQLSSAPSQLSQEKINKAFNQQKGSTSQRPKYSRRSTSSSISSLISRHRKTHSKASSTSSASLNSGPNSPRRVASPIPGSGGSHSPFPRNRRGRFNEPTIFPSSIRPEHNKVKLRRKSPFAGLSYGRRSSTSSNRKQQPAAKVIEEGEEEDIYEDIDDDKNV